MRIVNIIVIYNHDHSKVLMCHRQKNPYHGLFNFVGGKLEGNESKIESCYRELYEETNISKEDIVLEELMSFVYYKLNYELFVAVGTLRKPVELKSEKHPLSWIDVSENFEDRTRFAGDGNIQHIIDISKYKEFILD